MGRKARRLYPSITRDAQGKVIPLSQRFDPSKAGLRYSLEDKKARSALPRRAAAAKRDPGKVRSTADLLGPPNSRLGALLEEIETQKRNKERAVGITQSVEQRQAKIKVEAARAVDKQKTLKVKDKAATKLQELRAQFRGEKMDLQEKERALRVYVRDNLGKADQGKVLTTFGKALTPHRPGTRQRRFEKALREVDKIARAAEHHELLAEVKKLINDEYRRLRKYRGKTQFLPRSGDEPEDQGVPGRDNDQNAEGEAGR